MLIFLIIYQVHLTLFFSTIVDSTPATPSIATVQETRLSHLFTSSYIPINITSVGSNLSADIVSGVNSTITLTQYINYNFNINTTFPVATRRASPTDTTTIPEVYNNDALHGIQNTTLMFTPTSTTNTLYYVKVSDPSVYGTINIVN